MPREARVCDMHRAGTWTGSKSLMFAIQVEKFQPGFTRRILYSNGFSGLQIRRWINRLDSTSTRHSDCPSLNKRRLPRLSSPSEPLRERVNLIVMAAGKRQQLRNKRVEPGSVLWQQNRTALKQVDLGNEALLLVALGLVIDDINVLFPQRLDQAVADR